MEWAHAVRLDLAEEATARTTRWSAAVLEPMVTMLERTVLPRATLAVSGAAVRALRRSGCGRLVERIGRLAGARRLELASTAMHGALLPMLPSAEAMRQVRLNDAELLATFGKEVYRPATLWPPYLAVDHHLERVAAALQFSVMLVDERALPRQPWPVDRLPTSATLPGLVLVPSSRAGCRIVRDGRGGVQALETLTGSRLHEPSAIVTACEAGPRGTHFRGFLEASHGDRLVRVVEVVERLPASEPVRLNASAAPTSTEAIGENRPFAPWFRPGDPANGRMWRLATLAAEAWAALDAADFEALPEARALRFGLDRAWRAEFFVRGADLREWLSLVARPVLAVTKWLPVERGEELRDLVRELADLEARPPTMPRPPPGELRP